MPIVVKFEGVIVGEYIADLIVEGVVLIEIKTAKAIDDSHKAQTLNYTRATKLPIGLLINFGPSVEIKRFRS